MVPMGWAVKDSGGCAWVPAGNRKKEERSLSGETLMAALSRPLNRLVKGREKEGTSIPGL